MSTEQRPGGGRPEAGEHTADGASGERVATIRVILPEHLRNLARVEGAVEVEVPREPTLGAALDALEARLPVLRGAIRDHVTHERRAFVRFFAVRRDLSHEPPEALLPEEVARGLEPLVVVGAMAGG